jgi:hypothetical protein
MKRLIWLATCNLIFAAIPAGAGAGPPAPLTLAVGTHEGSPGETIRVPIEIRGARNLGPVQMLLWYDPEVLEVKTVEQGELLHSVMLDQRVLQPGVLQILMITSDTINGSGPAFVVHFHVIGKGGDSSNLKLDHVAAWQRDPSLEMLVTAENGSFKVRGFALPPWAWIAIAAAVLVVLLGVIFLRRKKAPGDHNQAVSSRPGKLPIGLVLLAVLSMTVVFRVVAAGPSQSDGNDIGRAADGRHTL